MARETRTAGQDAIFALTPPCESLRMILTLPTTSFGKAWRPCLDPASEQRAQVLLVDTSRAYFNARTRDDEPSTSSYCQKWALRPTSVVC